MCRYMSMGFYQYKYKCKWVCLDCRRCVKANHENLQTCVTCGIVMNDIGLDYRPPRKTNDSGWKELSKLVKNDVGFHSCGCEGPSLDPPRKSTDGGFYKMYSKDGKWVNR